MSDNVSANQLLRYQSLNFYREDMEQITEVTGIFDEISAQLLLAD